ncbi:MAG: VOC family protein [Halobacteriaceae archaeon]
MRATAIDHVNLRFPDDRLDEVVDFYVDTLGFESGFDDPHAAVADDPGLFSLDLDGDAEGGPRLFVNPSAEFDPESANYRHVAVRVPQSPADLRAFLEDAGVEVDHEAERERAGVGEYTSYYVVDPFGYTVELMAVEK